MMTRILTTTVLAALLALPAVAQTRPDPAQRPEPAPQTTPADPKTAPPEKIAPPASGDARESSGGAGEPLGDRLARDKGVIKPPTGVDPGMSTPAPDPGPRSMPVLPPPGTGHGDTVQPK